MATPYNHRDPSDKQIPLLIKQRDLSSEKAPSVSYIDKQIGVPTAAGKRIVIRLRTDSEHLATFFTMNWPADASSKKPDATIIALKESAESYGLAQGLNKFRWFYPKTRQVWMFGNEFYGNIKITVRQGKSMKVKLGFRPRLASSHHPSQLASADS